MRADAPTFIAIRGRGATDCRLRGAIFSKGRDHFFKGLRDLFQGFIFEVNDGERFAGRG